jgi:hypothetical protein
LNYLDELAGGWGGEGSESGLCMSKSQFAGKAPLRRRDFLAMSSLAAGAALLPGIAPAETLVRGQKLSVGYLEGSDRLDDVFRLPWRDLPDEEREAQFVVPADGLIAGDSSMAFSLIKIKLHGLFPAMPPSKLARVSSACLTVYFHMPWLGIPKPLPFHAWGARFGTRPTSGSPIAFVVPTREDGSLEMAFDIMSMPTGDLVPRRAQTDFTVDTWAGRPKLQRGIYLLGFESNTFARERQIPADLARAGSTPWELCSLVMSVDHLAEGDI